MQLKCEAEMGDESSDATVTFMISVGHGSSRGPVTHNFMQRGVCGLPERQQDWLFSEAVDVAS